MGRTRWARPRLRDPPASCSSSWLPRGRPVAALELGDPLNRLPITSDVNSTLLPRYGPSRSSFTARLVSDWRCWTATRAACGQCRGCRGPWTAGGRPGAPRPPLRGDGRPPPAHSPLGQLGGLRPPTCPQPLGQPLRWRSGVAHTAHRPDDDGSQLLSKISWQGFALPLGHPVDSDLVGETGSGQHQGRRRTDQSDAATTPTHRGLARLRAPVAGRVRTRRFATPWRRAG